MAAHLVEHAHGVGAAANAGHEHIGQAAPLLGGLCAHLAPNHCLEVAHLVGWGWKKGREREQ